MSNTNTNSNVSNQPTQISNTPKTIKAQPNDSNSTNPPNPTSNTTDNTKNICQFSLEKKLGEGTFGKVRLATHLLTNEKVAVKILQKSKILEIADKVRVEREIKILKSLMHPNIIQVYSVIQTQLTIYLIMEYCPGKELYEYIVSNKRLPESEAIHFFTQILSGIEYLHKIGIVHRDLKPENLLLNENKSIKIIDFGLSNFYSKNEMLKTSCGSPCYAAPEMISGKKYKGLSVDIWSLGVILFAMVCGFLPFEDPNNNVLYKKITEGKYTTPSFISEGCKDLIRRILTVDPTKRISVSAIKNHYWLVKIGPHKYSEGLIISNVVIPLDYDVIGKVVELGYEKEEVCSCVLLNKHNHITTTYYLFLSYKIKVLKESSVGDFTSEEFIRYIKDRRNWISNYGDKIENAVNMIVYKRDLNSNENDNSSNVNNNERILNYNGSIEERKISRPSSNQGLASIQGDTNKLGGLINKYNVNVDSSINNINDDNAGINANINNNGNISVKSKKNTNDRGGSINFSSSNYNNYNTLSNINSKAPSLSSNKNNSRSVNKSTKSASNQISVSTKHNINKNNREITKVNILNEVQESLYEESSQYYNNKQTNDKQEIVKKDSKVIKTTGTANSSNIKNKINLINKTNREYSANNDKSKITNSLKLSKNGNSNIITTNTRIKDTISNINNRSVNKKVNQVAVLDKDRGEKNENTNYRKINKITKVSNNSSINDNCNLSKLRQFSKNNEAYSISKPVHTTRSYLPSPVGFKKIDYLNNTFDENEGNYYSNKNKNNYLFNNMNGSSIKKGLTSVNSKENISRIKNGNYTSRLDYSYNSNNTSITKNKINDKTNQPLYKKKVTNLNKSIGIDDREKYNKNKNFNKDNKTNNINTARIRSSKINNNSNNNYINAKYNFLETSNVYDITAVKVNPLLGQNDSITQKNNTKDTNTNLNKSIKVKEEIEKYISVIKVQNEGLINDKDINSKNSSRNNNSNINNIVDGSSNTNTMNKTSLTNKSNQTNKTNNTNSLIVNNNSNQDTKKSKKTTKKQDKVNINDNDKNYDKDNYKKLTINKINITRINKLSVRAKQSSDNKDIKETKNFTNNSNNNISFQHCELDKNKNNTNNTNNNNNVTKTIDNYNDYNEDTYLNAFSNDESKTYNVVKMNSPNCNQTTNYNNTNINININAHTDININISTSNNNDKQDSTNTDSLNSSNIQKALISVNKYKSNKLKHETEIEKLKQKLERLNTEIKESNNNNINNNTLTSYYNKNKNASYNFNINRNSNAYSSNNNYNTNKLHTENNKISSKNTENKNPLSKLHSTKLKNTNYSLNLDSLTLNNKLNKFNNHTNNTNNTGNEVTNIRNNSNNDIIKNKLISSNSISTKSKLSSKNKITFNNANSNNDDISKYILDVVSVSLLKVNILTQFINDFFLRLKYSIRLESFSNNRYLIENTYLKIELELSSFNINTNSSTNSKANNNRHGFVIKFKRNIGNLIVYKKLLFDFYSKLQEKEYYIYNSISVDDNNEAKFS